MVQHPLQSLSPTPEGHLEEVHFTIEGWMSGAVKEDLGNDFCLVIRIPIDLISAQKERKRNKGTSVDDKDTTDALAPVAYSCSDIVHVWTHELDGNNSEMLPGTRADA
ncbi:hypothetical protein PIB30_065812 [Stylosanthes scabra]|uniref:Uncharacterized protein n=1 Tax=Stylosanthes scabra TaxID=79078 RepID=A0ABU6VN36_9FABA|nr:hypothetical protein [Stylosanthes scabra]